MSSVKQIAARWCPPALTPIARALLNQFGVRPEVELRGRYSTWQAALRESTGFDAPVIAQRVAEATATVLAGKAACERDSVTFEEMQWRWPMLAGMARQAARDRSALRVLDFGGALGGAFLTVRKFLGADVHLRWSVVEQPTFVQRAASLQFPPGIAFFDSIESAVSSCKPNLVIASGVLQCLAEPFDVLARLVQIGAGTLIVDRMPCSTEDRDIITVEHVAPSIYPAKFPTWLLVRDRIPAAVSHAYRELATFDAGDRLMFEGNVVEHRGWIFERSDCADA